MDASNPTVEQLQTQEAMCEQHGSYVSRAIMLPTFSGRPAKVLWSKCPECSCLAAEQEAVEKRSTEEQTRQKRIEDRLNRAAIPKRFRERSFASYIADSEGKRHALEVARRFADNFPEHARNGSTLVFAGNVGTGKCHLACAIAGRVLDAGHSAFFATAREIVLMLRARWDNSNAPSELETLRMLTSVSLLVIDEIGVQFNTDAERDQLFGVIDGRYRDMMPTIVTANLSRKLLQQAIGERSYSRLREDGMWVPFDWEDYRAKKVGR